MPSAANESPAGGAASADQDKEQYNRSVWGAARERYLYFVFPVCLVMIDQSFDGGLSCEYVFIMWIPQLPCCLPHNLA